MAVNLLVAFEVYLIVLFVTKATLRYRTTYGVLRLVHRSRKWPNVVRAATRHKGLLLTLPNLLWAVVFVAILATYAFALHVLYPGAEVTPGDLARHGVLVLLVALVGVLMVGQDVAGYFEEVRNDPLRARQRLDRAERAIRWTGPVGRLAADLRARRHLLRAGFELNDWFKRAIGRMLTRVTFGVVLWLPWVLGAA